jgi:hypothetical protein
MNNQVKPTDTKKLLEWLEARIEASKLKPVWFAYREMQKAVLVGTFAPDTPPVPTIKPGDKVHHIKYFAHTKDGIGIVQKMIGDDECLVNFFCSSRVVPLNDLEVVE